MKIKVVYSIWGADGADEPFVGGVQCPDERSELDSPSEALMRSIAGAEATGVVEVVECTADERAVLDAFVQSQEEGEAAYAKAQENGHWQHGNLLQFVQTARDMIDFHTAQIDDGDEDGHHANERDSWQRKLADAEAALEETEVPS